jgi:site-specific DNA-methyltransferase (adenine-specific)
VAAVQGVLSDEGSLFLNIGGKPKEPWVPFDVAQVVRRHFELQNVIHWVKSIAIMKEDVGDYPGVTGDVVVGHYKPINSPRFVNDAHEYVFHFTKTGAVPLSRLAVGVPYQDQSNVGRWKSGSSVHCRGNTWFIPYETIKNRLRQRPHPATYPPKLAEMCIRLHGVERARCVLDPFMGLGSTAVGAVEAGCPDVAGFEIDPEYTDWAVSRLKGERRKRGLVQRRLFRDESGQATR